MRSSPSRGGARKGGGVEKQTHYPSGARPLCNMTGFVITPNRHRLDRILPLCLLAMLASTFPAMGGFWRRLRRCPSSRGAVSEPAR